MPIWYEGILPEHSSVRKSVGIFDTSHMGRAEAQGEDAQEFINYIITNDVGPLDSMKGVYTVMCNPQGGIVDDLIVYKINAKNFLLVYNASNREKDFNWFKKNSNQFEVQLRDLSNQMAMIAVQGPNAVNTVQKICSTKIADTDRFQLTQLKILGFKAMVARAGYTGEDGFEIFLPDTPLKKPEKALRVWNSLLQEGAEFGIKPCGLGARDSLRLEAGLCLYGNDIDEKTNPLEARLRWVVKFKKPGGFIGRSSLLKIREKGVQRTRVGIKMLERGIPRKGYEVWSNSEQIGVVTSGSLSPTLGVGIAMTYVPRTYRKLGTQVGIKIRKMIAKGKIVKSHPFYDESKYGFKREK